MWDSFGPGTGYLQQKSYLKLAKSEISEGIILGPPSRSCAGVEGNLWRELRVTLGRVEGAAEEGVKHARGCGTSMARGSQLGLGSCRFPPLGGGIGEEDLVDLLLC